MGQKWASYINQKSILDRVHKKGKRITRDALRKLNERVIGMIDYAIEASNGHKTLTEVEFSTAQELMER